jgi:hypothetical protein
MQVLDVIKTVDGRQVTRLKDLAECVRSCSGELSFEIWVRASLTCVYYCMYDVCKNGFDLLLFCVMHAFMQQRALL